ncbi:hypothetical protein [uncultured Robinsoniella sp.]
MAGMNFQTHSNTVTPTDNMHLTKR